MNYLQESRVSRRGKLAQKESMDTINHATYLVEQAHNMRDKIQGKYILFSCRLMSGIICALTTKIWLLLVFPMCWELLLQCYI